MMKKTKLLRIFGVALLITAAMAMIWQLYTIFFSGMNHVLSGLALAATVCLPLIFGTLLLARSFDEIDRRQKTVRWSLVALFVFYLAALLGLLFVSRIDFLHFSESVAFYREHFDLITNFHPFETVMLYLRALKYNYIGPEIPISNLIGNMLLFMPMAVFLPCLFRPMRKFWVFALVMGILLVAVEALQLLLRCGSCDVDDVLLNFVGTLVVYGVLKIPAVNRLLERLYLMPQTLDDKQETITAG
jgi:glycopeptide antibiotics resistance protein